MRNGAKIAAVALLALAVAATFALRSGKRARYAPVPESPAAATPGAAGQLAAASASAPEAKGQAVVAAQGRPRLLELGSSRCQACAEMAKVLDALRASQGAKLQVDFIDVFEQARAAEHYKVTLIPTQILFDAAGREIFRHTGFFSHDDILAKFCALGVSL